MSLFKINARNSALLPEYFATEAIPPEVQHYNQSVSDYIAASPCFLSLSAQELRAEERRMGKVISPLACDRFIKGMAGNEIKIRQFIPNEVKGVYLFIHGGGWTSGGADLQDPRLESMAKAGQLAVLSVEYRLSPEHPYPAAIDDCEAAALWLIKNAKKEYGTENIVIGGGSAGAHLSVLTLIRLRERHAWTECKGANLVFGIYDLALTPGARNWGDQSLILSTPILKKLISNFLTEGSNPNHPSVSPLYADLHEMPRALFTVGTLDPLLDDSLFMYMRWISAGNQAELALCPGAIHGFTTGETLQAEAAKAHMLEFINSCLQ